MKKFLALALSLVMALSLVACGGSSTEEPADEGETAESGETGGETGGSGKIGHCNAHQVPGALEP